MALSAVGGLDAWLATDVPGGTPVSLALAMRARLEQALHGRAGFASSEALRPWGRQTPGVEVQAPTLYGLGRTRGRATLHVLPSRHTNKA